MIDDGSTSDIQYLISSMNIAHQMDPDIHCLADSINVPYPPRYWHLILSLQWSNPRERPYNDNPVLYFLVNIMFHKHNTLSVCIKKDSIVHRKFHRFKRKSSPDLNLMATNKISLDLRRVDQAGDFRVIQVNIKPALQAHVLDVMIRGPDWRLTCDLEAMDPLKISSQPLHECPIQGGHHPRQDLFSFLFSGLVSHC